ncbi:hypothetical protein [Pseudoduganella rhizocola]|uniref:hypothetical protein n=1 Tax=Pseudoduganella rhizocola TaxID=3382643 RepID=UPI0038B42CD0
MAGYKFPDPKKRSEHQPAVLCSNERVLALYNQDHPDSKEAKRVSKKVREWFHDEAHKAGWAGAGFIPDAATQSGLAGILWVPTTNTPTVLVIEDGAGKDDE